MAAAMEPARKPARPPAWAEANRRRPAEPRPTRREVCREARGGGAFSRQTPGKARQERDESAHEREKFLRCAQCGAVITRLDEAIAVTGGHEHTVVNPAGVVFTIRLFRHAPGCRFQGPPSPEFSWFPGYLWRLAYCGGCGRHLGWLFQGEGDRFVALIAAAIRELG